MVSSSNVINEEVTVEEFWLVGLVKKAISFPVFLGVLLAVAAGVVAMSHLADPDTWWHTKVGQWILATGRFPTHDIYSYTVHGHPWIAYEWLGEVLMGLAGRAGVGGLMWLLCGISAALLTLMYIYAYVYTRSVKAGVTAAALLLPLEGVFFTLRPQLIGYCFLVVLLILMELYRQGNEKALWFIPPLFLVWVNTHGTFFIGLGIFGVYWLCGQFEFEWGTVEAKKWTPRQSRHLLLTILASTILLPLTPYGTQLAAYPFEMAFMQPLNIQSIQEWQPLSFGPPWGKAFLILVVALLFLQLRWKPRYRFFDLVLLTVTIFAAAQHQRFIAVLVFAFLPIVAAFVGRWMTPYAPSKDKYLLNVALIALIVFGVFHFFPNDRQIDKRLGKTYPMKAIAYIQEHGIPEPLYNDYGWGGYLIWKFGNLHGSSLPVFIDGRADIYDYAGVLRDDLDIADLKPDTPFLFDKYQLRTVFTNSDSALATYLRASPEWSIAYQDKLSTIFLYHGKYPKAASYGF